MRGRLRLLPIVIFAAALVLSVRIGDLWSHLEVGVGDPSRAADAKKGNGLTRIPTKPAALEPLKKPATKTDAKPAAEKKGAPKKAAAAKPKAPKRHQDDDLSELDVKLLQQLAQRRRALDKREREIVLREGMLKAFEKRVDQKLAELKRIQTALRAEINRFEGEQKKRYQRLVKIYSNMKPKHAARVFDELDLPIAIEVVRRMSANSSAPILAAMTTAKAKAITAALAKERKIMVPAK